MFFCLVFVMPLCASFYLCLVVTCWERADLLALVWCLTVSVSLSHWYPGSGVVLDCLFVSFVLCFTSQVNSYDHGGTVSIDSDLCTLTYFDML